MNTASCKTIEQERDQMAIVCGHLLRTGYLLEGSELRNGLKLQTARVF